MHFVVQGQRVVAFAPVVANAGFAVDDEGVDAEAGEAGSDAEAGLAAADDDDGGVVVSVGASAVALVEPVLGAEVAGEFDAFGLVAAVDFRMAAQGLQRGGEAPAAGGAGGVGDEAGDSIDAARVGIEGEEGFDDRGAGAGDMAGRGAVGGEAEVGGSDLGGGVQEGGGEGGRAGGGLDGPGEGQEVAPMGVGEEGGGESGGVGLGEGGGEAGEPCGGRRCDVGRGPRRMVHGQGTSTVLPVVWRASSAIWAAAASASGKVWLTRIFTAPLATTSNRSAATCSRSVRLLV